MPYIGFIHDANLSVTSMHYADTYVFDTLWEAEQVIRNAGTWRYYTNVLGQETGAMLLSEPRVELYRVPNTSTPLIKATDVITDDCYPAPDVVLETGPRGGVQRAW